MSFVKTGDAQPVLSVVKPDEEMEEKAKKAQEQLKQDAKNISKDGNKSSFNTESTN